MPERQYKVVDNSAEIEAINGRIAERGYTPLQDHFGDWVAEKSGLTFATQKERAAFVRGASHALALRMEHQRSPENHAFKEERAKERAASAPEPKAAKAPAAKGRPGRKPAAAAAKPAATTEAPAKRPTRRAAATSTAPKRPARRTAKNAGQEVAF